MESSNGLNERINDEGNVLGAGIPLLLFKDTDKPPSISVHEAVAKGMGPDWTFSYYLEPTVREHFENTELVKEQQKKYLLSDDECGAIIYYTCDARSLGGTREDSPYCKINLLMSKRMGKELENWKDFLYFFLRGLQKIPNVTQQVFRALDKPISNLSKQYRPGNTVVWISFTSTSKDRSIVNNFIDVQNSCGTFMLINVIEGKEISQFSLFPEQEVLLLPNSIFNVNEIMSNEMKKLMNYPPSMDGIILTQKPTLPHLLLMKAQNQSKYETTKTLPCTSPNPYTPSTLPSTSPNPYTPSTLPYTSPNPYTPSALPYTSPNPYTPSALPFTALNTYKTETPKEALQFTAPNTYKTATPKEALPFAQVQDVVNGENFSCRKCDTTYGYGKKGDTVKCRRSGCDNNFHFI